MKMILARLVLLSVTVAFCVAFAEIAVRLVAPQPIGTWVNMRDGMIVHAADLEDARTTLGTRLDTNSIGMRDVEHAVEKQPGTLRILLMGDSFMEAYQVEWEESFAPLFERALAEALGRDVEVINASVSGWGTDDQRTYYRRAAHVWQPDLVLIGMTIHNDLFDNLLMEWSVLEDGQLIDRPREDLPLLLFTRLKVQEWLARHSHLYLLASGTLRAGDVRVAGRRLQEDAADLVSPDPPAKIERGWLMTELLLDRFAAELEADGAELVVFTVPLWLQVDPDHRRAFFDDLGRDARDLDLEAPQQRLAAWSARSGVEVIDPLPAFAHAREQGAGPLYLETDGHWNAAGHAVAARAVADALARSMGDVAAVAPPETSP